METISIRIGEIEKENLKKIQEYFKPTGLNPDISTIIRAAINTYAKNTYSCQEMYKQIEQNNR